MSPTTSTRCSAPSPSTRRGSGPAAPPPAATGGEPGLRPVPPAQPARRAGLAHADRGIPGPGRAGVQRARGRPPRALPRGARGPRRRLLPRSTARSSAAACGPTPAFTDLVFDHCCEGMYGAPSTAATGRGGLGHHRIDGDVQPRGYSDEAVAGPDALDAIIIGSGPGGSTAAEVLTKAGWSVVIMEKGRNHLLDPTT